MKEAKHVSAVVFLKSRSGKSVKELRGLPLPSDLDPYRAPPAAMDFVRHFFESCGVRVFSDLAGLMLHLNGTSSIFSDCFGTAVTGAETELEPPSKVKQFVESIVIVRPPEFI
jgi:hypothetical protein